VHNVRRGLRIVYGQGGPQLLDQLPDSGDSFGVGIILINMNNSSYYRAMGVSMDLMITYGLRVAPGIAALLLLLLFLPRKAAGIRITVYIALFIVIRDTMTPLGLWSFGTKGFFWIRFTDSWVLLLLIAAGSGVAAGAMLLAEPQWRARIEWIRRPPGRASQQAQTNPPRRPNSQETSRYLDAARNLTLNLTAGLVGAVLTAAPLLLLYTGTPIALRGGVVAAVLLPAIAAVALVGNFYEELLFRGFLQDYLRIDLGLPRLRSALLSGVAFAAGHSFLAVTVTPVGAPLLLFALYEGIIAGLIRMRWGLLPAVLSHGGAIFLLAGGLV